MKKLSSFSATPFTDVYFEIALPSLRPEAITKVQESIAVIDRALALIPWYERWLSPLNDDREWLVEQLEAMCKAALREGVVIAHTHHAS